MPSENARSSVVLPSDDLSTGKDKAFVFCSLCLFMYDTEDVDEIAGWETGIYSKAYMLDDQVGP